MLFGLLAVVVSVQQFGRADRLIDRGTDGFNVRVVRVCSEGELQV
jgi:hypothetical protein